MNNNEKLIKETLQKLVGEATQKPQTIYTESELATIKENFSGKDIFAKAIRKFFLQMLLNDGDKLLLRTVAGGLLSVLKKNFIPDLDPDAPLLQQRDCWANVNLGGKSVEDAEIEMEIRVKAIEYMAQRFSDLENGTDKGMRFSDLAYSKRNGTRENLINLQARGWIVSTLNYQLADLINLANREELTQKEIEKRNRKNSAK